jgi:TP901 family phage tail tape measure protein
MADRSARVTLEAIVAPYQRAMAEAAAATRAVSRDLNALTASSAQTAQKLQPLGTTMLGVGTAFALAGGFAVKAAIDYESAFAGVRKTTDATEAEFSALSDGIRGLSREMPTSAAEIAKVAETAGQLGVQQGSLLSFTETMVKLGETTNLSADQAATAMARIANIMQIPQGDVERLGATLVDLGNNGASTESEILEMATRIASAGKQVGLTGADVLAFANALSSVGIEAEAGGTAISRVMIEVQNAVMDGGETLDTFAQIAGSSATKFATDFQDKPAEAIITFIEGLRRLGDAGGNVNAVLETLGLSDIRVGNALRSAAGAGDLFRQSLEQAATGYRDNSALDEEYAKRLETTGAQLGLVRNNAVDLAISFGTALLPAIKLIAGVLGDLVEGFRGLPGPVQLLIAGGAVLAGTITLLGGGFLFLLPQLLAVQTAFTTLTATAPALAAGLRGVMIAAGAIGAVVAVASVAVAVFGQNSQSSAQSAQDFAAALEQQAQGAEHAVQALVAKKIVDQDLDQSAKRLGISTKTVAEAILGNAAAMQVLESAVSRAKGAMQGNANQDTQGDAIAAQQLLDAVRGLNSGYEDAVGAEERAGAAADDLGVSLRDTGDAADDAASEFGTLADQLDKIYDKAFSAQEAADGFNRNLLDFVDTVRAAQIEGDGFANSLDAGTETGLRNRDALRGLIGSLFDYASSTGASAETTAQMRTQLEYVLTQMGFNRDAVAGYLGVLNQIPGSIQTTVGVDTRAARAEVERFVADALKTIDVAHLGALFGWRDQQLAGLPVMPPAGDMNRYLNYGGPSSDAARERQQREAEQRRRDQEREAEQRRRDEDEAVRRYLQSLYDAEQDRKRLEEAVSRYLESVYQHRNELEDNQYELGVISKDKYLKILEDRLKGLEKYSNAWMAVYRQIQELEGKALESQLKMMEAFDRGREWQRAWEATADQRALSATWEMALNAQAVPIGSVGSSSVDNSRSYSPQFTVMTSDPAKAAALTNQKMRDGALLAGV